MYKVTVIMPVFNDEEYVAQSIESVLNQSLDEIELICINDGSTDSSPEILNEYSDKYPSIKVIHQKNCGASVSRNKAILLAKGEFITFLDSDDFYVDNVALEKMYDVAHKKNAEMVSANIKSFTTENKLVTNYNLKEFDEFKIISPEDYGIPYTFGKNIYKRSFIIENNFLFPEYSRGEDPVFLAEVLGKVKKIYCVPVILMGIRSAKYHGLLKIDTDEKKLGYLKHFKDTFEILEKNHFFEMKDRYKKKLFEFIKFSRNFADYEIYDMVQKVFKDDKTTLKQCNKLFKFSNPKISIIVFLKENKQNYDNLIDNFLRLKFRDTEFVFIHNKDINLIPSLKNFAKHDNRVRIVFNKHFNKSDMLNISSKYANGDYVLFLDPSDYLTEDSLNKLYNNAKKKKSDIVIFNKKSKEDLKNVYNLKNSIHNVKNVFDYKKIKKDIFDDNFINLGKMYNRYFLNSLDDSYYENENPLNYLLFQIQTISSAKRLFYINKPICYSNTDYNFLGTLEILMLFDIIEQYLRDMKLYKKFINEFNSFKIKQLLNSNIPNKSQKNYTLTRNELLRINLDSTNVNDRYLEHCKFIITHDSYQEYLSFLPEFELKELKYKYNIMQERYNEIEVENQHLKSKLNMSKKLNKDLLSSSSWKITKPFRGLK